MDRARNVVAMVGAVGLGVLVPVGAAYAGSPQPRPVPNPGTLVLLTSGLAGLAWWMRKRD
jgi:PEP-CTERM motif